MLHNTHELLYKVKVAGQIHVPVGDTIKPDWQIEQELVALHVAQY
jgi:hypothetical protein